MITCNNTDCAAMEGHVPACPLSALPSPMAIAAMPQEELDALRASVEAQLRQPGRATVMPMEKAELHDDSRFIISFDLDRLPTPQAVDIVARLMPEWLAAFLDANARYRKVGNELGYKGVLPDVNRKFGVLRARVWDGDEDTGREPTRGIMLDLIGHLFLMLHMMDDEEGLSLQSVQERAESMAKHPAGKARHPLAKDAEPQDLPTQEEEARAANTCSMAYGFDDQLVKCIKAKHGATTHHFGRKRDNTPVQWTDAGVLVP